MNKIAKFADILRFSDARNSVLLFAGKDWSFRGAFCVRQDTGSYPGSTHVPLWNENAVFRVYSGGLLHNSFDPERFGEAVHAAIQRVAVSFGVLKEAGAARHRPA